MSTNDKKMEVFNYIKRRLSDGTSPSVREIMDAMDFHSTSTAHRYIEMLINDGLLEKSDNLNRSLRLPNSSSASIPVIGTPENLSPLFRRLPDISALRRKDMIPLSFLH